MSSTDSALICMYKQVEGVRVINTVEVEHHFFSGVESASTRRAGQTVMGQRPRWAQA